jgi:hypothetical protein
MEGGELGDGESEMRRAVDLDMQASFASGTRMLDDGDVPKGHGARRYGARKAEALSALRTWSM